MDPVRERFIHLIYLAILFMQPALEPGGLMDWLVAVILTAAFAVWYLSMSVMKRWFPWLAVAVGFAFSFLNPGASVFFVYAARSEERRVGKSVDLGGVRIIKKKRDTAIDD